MHSPRPIPPPRTEPRIVPTRTTAANRSGDPQETLRLPSRSSFGGAQRAPSPYGSQGAHPASLRRRLTECGNEYASIHHRDGSQLFGQGDRRGFEHRLALRCAMVSLRPDNTPGETPSGLSACPTRGYSPAFKSVQSRIADHARIGVLWPGGRGTHGRSEVLFAPCWMGRYRERSFLGGGAFVKGQSAAARKEKEREPALASGRRVP